MANQGYYPDGLAPECLLKDDISQNFRLGSKDDPIFNAAMDYVSTGQCRPL